jgi:hypothetical protein
MLNSSRGGRPWSSIAVVPDLALGLAYLIAWAAPGLAGAALASWLILGVELEAAALLGAYLLAMALVVLQDRTAELRVRLAGGAIVLGLIAFVVVQVVRYDFWWPAVVLAGLLANRLWGLVSGALATEEARMQLFVDALLAVGLYIVAIAPTLYFDVPSPGAGAGPLPPMHARWCAVAADLVERLLEKTPAGSWCAEPHRALAGGALYFLASAFRDARRIRKASTRR